MTTGSSLIRPAARAHVLWTYRSALRGRSRPALRYLLHGKELSNFTYEIGNEEALVPFLAKSLARSPDLIENALAEFRADAWLRGVLRAKLAGRPNRESEARFGRRAGWYCVTRVEHPTVVVETGTRDGLGSAVIARALQRNDEEGLPGRLMTFDTSPDAGWLIPDELRELVDVHIGDTAVLLGSALADINVDVFIHDSHHTYEHESLEFREAYTRARDRQILISDNAHATSALADFARLHDARYEFFRELPVDHFYPGGGIGIAAIDGRPAGSGQ